MSIFTRNRLLIFIILLLVATNVSTLVTVWHKKSEMPNFYPSSINDSINKPQFKRGRHFRDELDLSPEQFQQFRQLRHQYFPIANSLKLSMYDKRIELLNELSKEQPDTVVLNQISRDIGDMHTQMKMATNDYFINMKKVCSPQQQDKLVEVFESMLGRRNGMRIQHRGRSDGFKGRGVNRNNE